LTLTSLIKLYETWNAQFAEEDEGLAIDGKTMRSGN